MILLLSAEFSKLTYLNILSGTLRVSNCLDPDHVRQNVGPDLGSYLLQRLSTSYRQIEKDAASKERVKG